MRVRRSVAIGAYLAASGVIALAQQGPVFRAGVTLVRVDVTVLDRDGKPVPGLTADDFEVKLDGKAEPVRTVAFEEAPAAPAAALAAPTTAAAAAPPREVTNAVPAADPRVFVLLVDDLVIPATRDKDLFFSASRFVASLPPTDLVGFTTSSGAVSVNPTHDRAAVEAGLRRISGQFVDPRLLPPSDLPLGLDEAIEIYEGDTTQQKAVVTRDCALGATSQSTCQEDIEQKVRRMVQLTEDATERQKLAYIAVINALNQVPGQKNLVILTDGLLITNRGHNGAPSLEPIARAAAAAGVELNVLYGAPEAVSITAKSAAQNEVARQDGVMLMQGIQTVADMTGGNFWRVMGQPDRFFSFLALATSGVYHLGVEAPSGTPATRDFTLAARVKRSGLTVHANRVALLPDAEPAVPVDARLQNAVTRGAPNYGVPLTMATVLRRGASDSTVDLGANFEIPGSTPGPVTVMFGLLDASGRVHTGKKTVDAPAPGADYRVSLSLPVPPGTYRLRLAVADATGHVGSIDAPVIAQLDHVGPLLASSLMTAWTGSDNVPQFLALEEIPPAAAKLNMLVELYPAAGSAPPTDVRVQWIVRGDGSRTVVDQTVTPARSADRLTAQGELPVGSLPAGTYEIKGTVLVDGQPVGAVTTTVRKPPSGGNHALAARRPTLSASDRATSPPRGRRPSRSSGRRG